MLDATGGSALMRGLCEEHAHETAELSIQRFAKIGTKDLRVDFLRPGLGRHLVASAEITRRGDHVGSTQMRLHNEVGLLIATAAAA